MQDLIPCDCTYRNGFENGTNTITGKTKLKKVIAHISNCDNKTSEIVVQDLIKVWSRNYDNQQQQYEAAKCKTYGRR